MWLQEIDNGSTLLFAFFMISDPMTTPQHRGARLVYVAAVAAIAFIWQYVFFKPHGLIVALLVCSWIVPAINTLYCRNRFTWAAPRSDLQTCVIQLAHIDRANLDAATQHNL